MEKIDIIFDEKTIQKRIKELAKELTEKYKGKEVVFVCTLKGAVFFACDLLKNFKGDAILEFIKISSYVGEKSTGKVSLNLNVNEESIKGREVVIIEDIVDTGYSLKFLYDYLEKMKPKTLSSCALLDKKEKRIVPIEATYIGFEIPDLFVIGYGLDYDQKCRNLPYIGVVRK